MKSCVLIHCKNSQKTKNESALSFHSIPSNPHLRNEWISIIRKSRKDDNWIPQKCSAVCSLHFKKEDFFYSQAGKYARKLRKAVLPTLCLSASRSTTDTTEDPVEIVTVPEFENHETMELKNEIDIVPETEKQKNEFSDSSEELPINEIEDSDLDSIYDNPIESHLRDQLRKKQKLAAKHKQTLKSLYEKYKCLRERDISTKRELKQLKTNMARNKKK